MLEIAKREPVRTSVTGANITGVFHPGAVGAYFFVGQHGLCVREIACGEVVRSLVRPRVLHVISCAACRVCD